MFKDINAKDQAPVALVFFISLFVLCLLSILRKNGNFVCKVSEFPDMTFMYKYDFANMFKDLFALIALVSLKARGPQTRS